MALNVVMMGPPGAGKGTQAERFAREHGIPKISTGDMLRSAIANQTETGLKAKEYMDQGQLVPDQVVIDIVKERLAMDDCRNGYILDGFPRTVEQAKALSEFADIDAAINLDVPDEVLVNRLSGRRVCPACGAPFHVDRLNGATDCKACDTPLIQRDDDKPETVLNRLKVYHQKTAPLIDHYQGQGKLKNIFGGGDLESITAEILTTLEAIR